jgi:hypothetical protein
MLSAWATQPRTTVSWAWRTACSIAPSFCTCTKASAAYPQKMGRQRMLQERAQQVLAVPGNAVHRKLNALAPRQRDPLQDRRIGMD